jgi:pimeloyl-ACP methyl ester carboxylesterase
MTRLFLGIIFGKEHIKMPPTQTYPDIPVSWRVDDIEIHASLTRPAGAGPFPAVIFVAGSGPTDRNWNTPLLPGSNGSAGLLSQALTAAGVITLRYDKSASGPDIHQNIQKLIGKISLHSHLEELAGGVRLLTSHAEVDPRRIFVLANSEGCIHALNYQTQSGDLPFTGLILTAAPARALGALARSQIAAQINAVPGGEIMLAQYDAAIADFLADRPVNGDPNLPEGLRNVILAVTNPANLPFSREIWEFDPAALLIRVTQPVLIVIGKKDIQVDWQADGAIFEAIARENPAVTLVYPENANHVLKYEGKPRDKLNPAEAAAQYNNDEMHLEAEALSSITTWLSEHL